MKKVDLMLSFVEKDGLEHASVFEVEVGQTVNAKLKIPVKMSSISVHVREIIETEDEKVT